MPKGKQTLARYFITKKRKYIHTHKIDWIVAKPWYVPCNGLENWNDLQLSDTESTGAESWTRVSVVRHL